jgi:predicted DNA-binding antitoxin AbrB/MazE fold protein
MVVAAKYENGVFKPLEEIAIDEGTVVEVYVRTHGASKPRSVRDLGFVGMWADRDDIADGVSYVDKLRDNPRGL